VDISHSIETQPVDHQLFAIRGMSVDDLLVTIGIEAPYRGSDL
jgi:hypothetical protein